MINSKIIQTLEPLNVPIHWMNYNGDESKYIIFQCNSQDDIKHHDDIVSAEQIEIGLTYWFNSPESVDEIFEIKNLMKENGFIKLSEEDNIYSSLMTSIKNDEYFGRSFKFKYIKHKKY